MGGEDSNENLIALTAEEHYVIHQLLVKIYPNNHKLIHAANMMGGTRPNNKSYGWIRRKQAKASSVIHKGKTVSKETRKRMSEAHKGKKSHNFGKTHSKETLKKMSEVKKGENNPNYGRTHSKETLKKMSESLKGQNHPNFKPLSQADKDLIMQFPDWKDKNPKTIYNRLKKQNVIIGKSRIKRLQDSYQ